MSKRRFIDEHRLYRCKGGYWIIDEADFGEARFPKVQSGSPGSPYPFKGPALSATYRVVGNEMIFDEHELVTIPHAHMLHRKFAELSGDCQQILLFAQQYGSLGRIVVHSDTNKVGEYISEWVAEIERVRVLLEIYDGKLAKQRLSLDAETEVLSKLVRERTSDRFTAMTPTASLIRSARARWSKASRPKLYWHLLGVEIERELALGVDVTVSEFKPGGILQLCPKDLLAAIYVHFLNEIIGSVRAPIKCGGCGRWFTSKDARSKYCSNACRVRQYRARKREETNGN